MNRGLGINPGIDAPFACYTIRRNADQLAYCIELALCWRFANGSYPMTVSKSHVVSVRVEPHIKNALQSAAALEMRSLANMVEVIVVAYCRAQGYPLDGALGDVLPNINMRGSTDYV